ncbi:MAG: protein phosphatase 2C domain-containing protein, partial [Pirellula sp.]
SFQERDLVEVTQFMVDAVQAAWMAVVQAANKRLSGALGEDDPYTKILGRPLNQGDFSTTLLLAVHTTVMRGGDPINLVFCCGVGDGMIAGIGSKGETSLLMTADSGEHSGETRFLDERETAPEKLKSRVFTFLGQLRALMLMTDGVADDYFPNTPGMSYLYGDLLLNGIISSKIPVNQEEEKAALALEKVTEESYMTRSEQTVIRSIKSIAEQLGKTPTEIWSNSELLGYFAKGDPICQSPDPSERLRLWLDNYQVRGSFDDRTLVAMYH